MDESPSLVTEAYLPSSARHQASQIQNSLSKATSFAVVTPERLAINRSSTEVMHILLIISLALLALPLILVVLMDDLDEIDRKTERVHQGTSIGTSRVGVWICHFMRGQANR